MSSNEKTFSFNVANIIWILFFVGVLVLFTNAFSFHGIIVLDKDIEYGSVLSILTLPTYIYFVFHSLRKIKENKNDYIKIDDNQLIYRTSEGTTRVAMKEITKSHLIHNLMNKEIFIETNGSNFLIDAFGFPREVLKLPEMIEQNKNSKVGIDKS